MEITDLSRSLFGYKKEDVYSYCSQLSADFSNRLKDFEKEKDLKISDLEEKISTLESSLEAAEKEKLAKISALEDNIALLRNTLETVQRENTEMKRKTGLLVSSVGDAQQRSKQLTHQLEQLWGNLDLSIVNNGKA